MTAIRIRSLLRRAAALALILCLTAGCALAAGKNFRPKTAKEGKQLALSLLHTCAFYSEYGSGTDGRTLARWEEPIRVWVGGTATANDLKELDSFLMQLSFRVPHMPPITRVSSQDDANMQIFFVKLANMEKYVSGYVRGNWGFFSYFDEDGVINRAEIAIARDKANQKARYHILKEEIVGALGLANDHEVYKDSILYQKWTTVRELSDVDWLMLNMLYSVNTAPGMTWTEAESSLRSWVEGE